MSKGFTDTEIGEMEQIRAKWEVLPDVLSVQEVTASNNDFGKHVSGNIIVRRGKISKQIASDIQEAAFVQVPDMSSFSILITDSDQKTTEYIWEAGGQWQERIFD